ncbi:MAG TPA: CDGSH iron-sulfur domain-containing protein [Actinomycetota bacterium]|jgi:CDGSH-type Zn-finger protein
MSGSFIQPYADGPYVVRGDFTLIDEDGREVELHRRTIALCRCGRSRMKPFCDGTHKTTGRRANGARGAASEGSSPPAG